MIDPLKAAIGVQRLVLRHYPALLEGRGDGTAMLRLDQQGGIVGDAGDAVAPGRGYYAHIQLTGIAVGAAVGGETDIWEVHGPDWEVLVAVHDPAGGGPARVTCEIRRSSPAGLAFLAQQE